MEITRYDGNGRMSAGVIYNHVLYLSGLTARGTAYDAKEQTRVVLEKVEKNLEKYGSGKDKLLTATIYLKDMSFFAEMNEVWDSWVLPGAAPTRACVQAPLAAEELIVEIVVTAAV